ncbi:MAG: hypothetical protein QOJ85_3446 [Solirubrobacteraceae bacterium]|nr:hypothetical protein [Solirubrobacteraceae bacterium]
MSQPRSRGAAASTGSWCRQDHQPSGNPMDENYQRSVAHHRRRGRTRPLAPRLLLSAQCAHALGSHRRHGGRHPRHRGGAIAAYARRAHHASQSVVAAAARPPLTDRPARTGAPLFQLGSELLVRRRFPFPASGHSRMGQAAQTALLLSPGVSRHCRDPQSVDHRERRTSSPAFGCPGARCPL